MLLGELALLACFSIGLGLGSDFPFVRVRVRFAVWVRVRVRVRVRGSVTFISEQIPTQIYIFKPTRIMQPL